MGLFNDDLNKTAVATAKVIHLLGDLEPSVKSHYGMQNHKDDFFFYAYIIRFGILDRIEKNKWSLMQPITIPTGLFGTNKTNIGLALNLKLVKDDYLISGDVEDILSKRGLFWEYDRMLTVEQKAKI
jgi:hypothetical protein